MWFVREYPVFASMIARPDSPHQLVGPDSPHQLVGPDSPHQLVGPDSPHQLVGPDPPHQLLGPDSPHQLAVKFPNTKNGKLCTNHVPGCIETKAISCPCIRCTPLLVFNFEAKWRVKNTGGYGTQPCQRSPAQRLHADRRSLVPGVSACLEASPVRLYDERRRLPQETCLPQPAHQAVSSYIPLDRENSASLSKVLSALGSHPDNSLKTRESDFHGCEPVCLCVAPESRLNQNAGSFLKEEFTSDGASLQRGFPVSLNDKYCFLFLLHSSLSLLHPNPALHSYNTDFQSLKSLLRQVCPHEALQQNCGLSQFVVVAVDGLGLAAVPPVRLQTHSRLFDVQQAPSLLVHSHVFLNQGGGFVHCLQLTAAEHGSTPRLEDHSTSPHLSVSRSLSPHRSLCSEPTLNLQRCNPSLHEPPPAPQHPEPSLDHSGASIQSLELRPAPKPSERRLNGDSGQSLARKLAAIALHQPTAPEPRLDGASRQHLLAELFLSDVLPVRSLQRDACAPSLEVSLPADEASEVSLHDQRRSASHEQSLPQLASQSVRPVRNKIET